MKLKGNKIKLISMLGKFPRKSTIPTILIRKKTKFTDLGYDKYRLGISV